MTGTETIWPEYQSPSQLLFGISDGFRLRKWWNTSTGWTLCLMICKFGFPLASRELPDWEHITNDWRSYGVEWRQLALRPKWIIFGMASSSLLTVTSHGSWDSPESFIGSFIYGHTNLTEIDEALKLLWRNKVPANQVNLGIGFYGRTYTLSDPKCNKPGCPFDSGGIAGPCTVRLHWQSLSTIIDILYGRAPQEFFLTRRYLQFARPTTWMWFTTLLLAWST